MTEKINLDPARLRKRTRLVLDYLERVSADSTWAHRASGLRGSLWQAVQLPLEEWDEAFMEGHQVKLKLAVEMLNAAAMEIPGDWLVKQD